MFSFESVTDTVADFPRVGIQFVDLSRLLFDVKTRNLVLDFLVRELALVRIDAIVGLESRGFLLGMALADRMQLPFVMVRKAGKLPPPVVKVAYSLEYGHDEFELQSGHLTPDMNVALVDDVLATGGSLLAAANLVTSLSAQVSSFVCLGCVDPAGRRALTDAYPQIPLIVLPPSVQLNLEVEPIETVGANRMLLLFHPSMKSIAWDMVDCSSAFELGTIHWDRFPDGSPDLKIPKNMAGRRVVFLASMFDLKEWLEQLSILMILGRQDIRSLDIILPYFSPATMERVECPSTVATADTLAQIMSCCLSPTVEGVPVLSIFDLHASTVRFSFSPKDVRFRPLTAIDLVMNQMDAMCGVGKYAIAFPDEGSYKRFRARVKEIHPTQPFILFAKVRVGQERHLQMVETSHPLNEMKQFKHVLIMDDLVQSGGTLDECRRAVKALGTPYVSCFVTHAVMPNKAYLDFLPGGKKAGFDNFWITDSNPQLAQLLADQVPFRVLPLAPVIANAMRQRHRDVFQVPDEKTVCLASTNLHKFQAASNAFNSWRVGYSRIRPFAVNSGVSPQPIGWKETTDGAMNRLRQVGDRYPRVAMENGLVEDDKGQWCDVGVVVYQRSADRAPVVSHTRMIPVDSQLVCEAKENQCTIGDMYHIRYGYDAQAWHVEVCGMSRQFLLTEAFTACLRKESKVYITAVRIKGGGRQQVLSCLKTHHVQVALTTDRNCFKIQGNCADLIKQVNLWLEPFHEDVQVAQDALQACEMLQEK